MAEEEKTPISEEGQVENKKSNLEKDKAPKKKEEKLSKADKKALKQKEKEKQKAYDEWEEGISKNKRVRGEELRKKVKRAMLVMLVFSMIATSVVYTTLLFIEENNVRITATSNEAEKGLALSMDNSIWTPYLNGRGPESMGDITYNALFENETHPWTVEKIEEVLTTGDPVLGNRYEDNYIAFMFMLKNTANEGSYVACEMSFEVPEKKGLENACRVMWGTSFSQKEDLSIHCYSTLSDNEKLANLDINKDRTKEDGYLEYWAYPYNRDKKYVYGEEEFDSLVAFEAYLTENGLWEEARQNGYVACEPFASDEYVFQNTVELEKGEIMYCYIQIWLEGSDYDCVDAVTQGKVQMSLNFTVIA